MAPEFGNKPSRFGGKPQDLKQAREISFLLEFQGSEQQTNNDFPVPLLGRSIIPERQGSSAPNMSCWLVENWDNGPDKLGKWPRSIRRDLQGLQRCLQPCCGCFGRAGLRSGKAGGSKAGKGRRRNSMLCSLDVKYDMLGYRNWNFGWYLGRAVLLKRNQKELLFLSSVSWISPYSHGTQEFKCSPVGKENSLSFTSHSHFTNWRSTK